MSSVSVIVAPRERYSSVVTTIEELLRTVPEGTPIFVVEGGSPPLVKREIKRLKDAHNFVWVSEKNPIIPNRARNLGMSYVTTDYVVFVDNDILFEPHWLEHLVARADKDKADVVAPMICIGPPRAHLIHHAGGIMELAEENGFSVVKEAHRLMNVPIANFCEEHAPVANEVSEFHCVLVRRDLFEKIGPLDERLITREQMDFALRCKLAKASVRFEKNSVVTYSARVKFQKQDLQYHLFRWSDELTVRSLEAFEQSWNTPLDKDRIRFRWIQSHRRRAILGTYPVLRILPESLRRRLISRIERTAIKGLIPLIGECQVPPQPTLSARELVQSRPGH